MRTTIQKWGNSLGVRIPKVIAAELGLESGSEVDLFEESDKIIIQPQNGQRLKDLLSRINAGNLHGEIESGDSVGKEAW